MAITSTETSTPDSKKVENNNDDELLVRLARVYTFVKSRELTKTLSSYTFDDYIAQAKDEIKTDQQTNRPSKLGLLDKLEDDINSAISQARQRNS